MMVQRFLLVMGIALTFSLPSFAGVNNDIEEQGQYWQRVHTSSALYLRGPKAQQMLNRDIARCVTELRELERLGAVRDAIPEYAEGLVVSSDEAELLGWDFPERDKDLYAEHNDYIDFEGCMMSKGWERIKYVPYDVAMQAQENYKKTHSAYRKQARKSKFVKQVSDYDNLNQ